MRKWQKILILTLLIISSLFVIGNLILWLAMAGLSFMAFDAGFSWSAFAFVLLILSIPLMELIFLGLSFYGFYKSKFKFALWSLIPLYIIFILILKLIGFFD